MKKFYIEITTGTVTLDEQQIWPDGGAPAKPTAADVEALIEASGPLDRVLTDWALDLDLQLFVSEVKDSTHGMCECSDCSPKLWKGATP